MQARIIEDIAAWESSSYKSQYFRKSLSGTDYVLCLASAAEFLGLCNWTTEPYIYVYTKEDCARYHIQTASKSGLYYTTVSQTINDLLADDTIDEQVVLESLADQYYKNNYADLIIQPKIKPRSKNSDLGRNNIIQMNRNILNLHPHISVRCRFIPFYVMRIFCFDLVYDLVYGYVPLD